MSKLRRCNRSAGFIARLTAGIILLAAAEGASADVIRDSIGGRGIGDAKPTPSNVPRGGQTAKLTPPVPDALAPPPAAADANPLARKPLRYLIGADSSGPGRDDAVTVVSYDTTRPAQRGISIAYGNLFDEHNTGRYGPYLHTSDTAAQYNEGQIDPRGPGWEKNLREQFTRRKKQGFEYIELDNADAYAISDVIGAIELAASHGLKVIAKNPGLLKGILSQDGRERPDVLSQDGRERPDVLSQDGRKRPDVAYVAHPNIHGVIVEKDAGRPADMEALRRKAGKPNLPVWFVAFGSGRGWAASVASSASQYRHMGVTYSSAGEYGNAIDILPPG